MYNVRNMSLILEINGTRTVDIFNALVLKLRRRERGNRTNVFETGWGLYKVVEFVYCNKNSTFVCFVQEMDRLARCSIIRLRDYPSLLVYKNKANYAYKFVSAGQIACR